MFRKLLDEGRAGDNIGVLLRGTKREEVERGQVLAKPEALRRTRSLMLRPTFSPRRKVGGTRHFLTATGRSSISEPPT